MQIFKPLNVSVLIRPFRYYQKNFLAFSSIIYVDNQESGTLLSEQQLWIDFKNICYEDFDTSILDTGIPKSQPEIIVFGYGYGKYSEDNRTAVSIIMNNVKKNISVFGDRFWDGDSITSPQEFVKIPINWKNSFGGPDYKFNPIGTGLKQDGESKIHKLPNVENDDLIIYKKSDKPIPRPYVPMFIDYPEKNLLMGTYDNFWRENDFPGFARDIDWSYFNIAFPDQRLNSINIGDTATFINMNESFKTLSMTVPPIKAKVFLCETINSPSTLESLDLDLKTFIAIPHLNRSVLIYQNSVQVDSDDDSDFDAAMFAIESIERPRDEQHYKDVFYRRTNKKTSLSSMFRDEELVDFSFLGDEKKFKVSDSILKSYKRTKEEITKSEKAIEESQKNITSKINPSESDINQVESEINEQKKIIPNFFQKNIDSQSKTSSIYEIKEYLTIKEIDQIVTNETKDVPTLLQIKKEEKALKEKISKKVPNNADVSDSVIKVNAKFKHNEQRLDKNLDNLHIKSINTINTQHNNLTDELLEDIDEEYDDLDANLLQKFSYEDIDLKENLSVPMSFKECLESISFKSLIVKNETIADENYYEIILNNTILKDVVFQRVNFENCTFENLIFKNCKFIDCKFNRGFISNTLFINSYFSSCTLENISFDNINTFDNCDLVSSKWSFITSDRIKFLNVKFTKCHFETMVLSRCFYDGVFFKECSFLRVGFSQGRLTSMEFANCNSCESIGFMFRKIVRLKFKNSVLKTCSITRKALIEDFLIENTSFENSGFRENHYKDFKITNSNLSKNDFSSCVFESGFIENTSFKESLFLKGRFIDVKCESNDFSFTNFKEVKFNNSYFKKCSFFTSEMCMIDVDSKNVFISCLTKFANFVPRLEAKNAQ